VVSATPALALGQRFQQTAGWTGGDVAYSIPLSQERTLWLFGDSFIGKIESGRRPAARMISNAAAWQPLQDDQEAMRFFWDRSGAEPAPLLRPTTAGAWYWPADGVVVDRRLYLFCKVVRKAEGAPGFQFDWFANDLLRIDNPQEEPVQWKIERCRLPEGKDAPRLGASCVCDGDYLYAFGLFPAAAVKPLHVPLGLARLPKDRLATLDMKGWQYWCRGPEGDRWSAEPVDLVPLFTDAAPEMTVGRVRGIDGWVAVYTPVGIGTEVAVRQAPKPWGPWSQRQVVYRSPEPGDKVFVYGAKAHPELSRRDGQLFITYCRNIGGDLDEHVRRPEVYVPQAIEVRLRSR
jgi:hypothetical protein